MSNDLSWTQTQNLLTEEHKQLITIATYEWLARRMPNMHSDILKMFVNVFMHTLISHENKDEFSDAKIGTLLEQCYDLTKKRLKHVLNSTRAELVKVEISGV
jgi:hypothetical protein